MSPVGVTPLAGTMNDLATVYLMNRDSLEALLTQVELDLNGVTLGSVAAPQLAAPAIALTSASAAGDSFVPLSDPFANGMAGSAIGSETADQTLAPYGGLMGDALSGGADAVGSPALAQRLAPAGVQFGADGKAYRLVDATASAGGPAEGTDAGPPAGSAHDTESWEKATTTTNRAGSQQGAPRVARHAHRSGTGVDAGAGRSTSGHAHVEPAAGRPGVPEPPKIPELPKVPDLPIVPHAGVAAGPVTTATGAQFVPAAFDGTGAPSANPAIGWGPAVAAEPNAAAAAAPLMGGAGVIGIYDNATGTRSPQWLHESEDVWGEDVVVTPAVIGEVDAPNPLRAPRLL